MLLAGIVQGLPLDLPALGPGQGPVVVEQGRLPAAVGGVGQHPPAFAEPVAYSSSSAARAAWVLSATSTKSPSWSPNCISTRYSRPARRRRHFFSLPCCSQPGTTVPRPRKTSSLATGIPTAARLARVASIRCTARLER